jgi:NAD-dependent dihydropyrimidine dehydrogenase PreA subunit
MDYKHFEYEIKNCSSTPIIIDVNKCICCGRCAEICQVDILIPQKQQPPIVAYPGECYYCGACVMECPVKDAISLRHPLMNTARFIPIIKENNKLTNTTSESPKQ